MKRGRVYLLGVCWGMSLLAAAGFTWWWTAQTSLPARQALDAHPDSILGNPIGGETDTRIADLEKEIDELQRTREQLLRDYLALGLRQAFENAPAAESGGPETPPLNPPEIETLWNERVAVMETASDWGDSVEAMAALVTHLAALGEPGVRFLVQKIRESDEDSEPDRDDLLMILSWMPHPSALGAILDFQDSPLIEPSDRYEVLSTRLRLQGPDSAAAATARLVDELSGQLGQRDEASDERMGLLAILALVREDGRAFTLLRDMRVQHENVREALNVASHAHSERARAFVEDVAQYHADAEQRQRAEEMLSNW